MVDSIDHVNIVVSDLERSIRFYVDVLGMKETKRAYLEGDWIEAIVGLKGVRAKVGYVQPVGGGPRIELLEYEYPQGAVVDACAQPNTVGLRHVALRVADMETVCARLRAANVDFIGDVVSVPGHVVRHDAGDKTLCYFRDPDGVILELAEYR